MPEYKSLKKLMDNLSIDLQNKSFKDAEKFEELLAIKWVLSYVSLIHGLIKVEYTRVTSKPIKTTPIQEVVEAYESLPDNTPL